MTSQNLRNWLFHDCDFKIAEQVPGVSRVISTSESFFYILDLCQKLPSLQK